tara:strand:- start:7784 stop:8587 length:804 start_codon:yes stop_codon:yes gene_type:complete
MKEYWENLKRQGLMLGLTFSQDKRETHNTPYTPPSSLIKLLDKNLPIYPVEDRDFSNNVRDYKFNQLEVNRGFSDRARERLERMIQGTPTGPYLTTPFSNYRHSECKDLGTALEETDFFLSFYEKMVAEVQKGTRPFQVSGDSENLTYSLDLGDGVEFRVVDSPANLRLEIDTGDSQSSLTYQVDKDGNIRTDESPFPDYVLHFKKGGVLNSFIPFLLQVGEIEKSSAFYRELAKQDPLAGSQSGSGDKPLTYQINSIPGKNISSIE